MSENVDRPHACTESELAKVGVDLVDPNRTLLRCQECGQTWSPDLQSGGRLPSGYWKCPAGCNAH